MTAPTWPEVEAEHLANNGFVEGPGNRNPWSEEVGAGDAAYCISAACIVPYHHGVRWWPDSQYGEKGFAYCPFAHHVADRHGSFMLDRTSAGRPCDLIPGDIILIDWNGDGVADHAETVLAVYADLTFDTVGYNTGHPEGCHVPIRRDRKFLLGRIRMLGTFYVHVPTPSPLPSPGPAVPAPIHYVRNGRPLMKQTVMVPIDTSGNGKAPTSVPWEKLESVTPQVTQQYAVYAAGPKLSEGNVEVHVKGYTPSPPPPATPWFAPVIVISMD